MKKVKKYAFSLLEIAIGLTLAAFLLTSLFNNYYYLMKANMKLQTVRDLIHERSIFIFRMNQIWNNLIEKPIRFSTEISPGYYSTKVFTLNFTYNNGLDRDANYCHEIEGFLGCNDSNQFCLFSKGKDQVMREEILWKKGKEYTFSFFDPKQNIWVSEWQTPTILPPLLKISFGDEEFIFPLVLASHKVNYS